MLIGRKVRLRAIERADIPTFVRWLNDPEVRRFLLLFAPMSAAQEERWFERQLDDASSTILAIETPSGVHIGNIGLEHMDWKNSCAELGIFIGEKAYWGLGYGTDAIRTMLAYAFDDLNLHRVYLSVFDFNERAIRSYEKCGFRHEGRQRHRLYQGGEYHDVLLMSILDIEFVEARNAWSEVKPAAPLPSEEEQPEEHPI